MVGTARHVVPAELSALATVRRLVASALAAGGFPDAWRNRIQVAVDEAVTNIIEHGCPTLADATASSSVPRTITIGLRVDARACRIEIDDEGMCFDPHQVAAVDVGAHVAAGKSGGLGVFLLRQIMDVVDYHAEQGRPNRLVLIKRVR